MKRIRPDLLSSARSALFGLAILLAGHPGLAQTPASYVADGKAALTLSDPETARTAFANALVLEPGNEEAHFYLGLVELLLVAENGAVTEVFSAANAELRIDWTEGMLKPDWQGLADARARIGEAVGWQFAADTGAVGGDVVRGLGGAHEFLDFTVISLRADAITGPGTVRFRVRSDGVTGSYVGLELFAEHVSESWGTGLGFLEPTADWFDAEMFVPEGEFDLVWRAFSSGSGTMPSIFLDQLRYVPQSGPASPQDDAAGSGESLANGLDNGDFALAPETLVELAYDDSDFLDPDFHTGWIHALIGGEITTSIESALAHLAAVGSPEFLSTLVLDADTSDMVTIDAGDVLALRALLEAGLTLGQLLYAENLDLNPTVLDALGESGALETFQGFLVAFPHLLKKAHPEASARAEAALRRAFARYEEASDFIRARPPDLERLFNLPEDELADEEALRDEFSRIIAALDAPETVELPEVEPIDLNLGALMEGTTVWRDLLPDFEGDRPIAGSFPDASFNGLFAGAETGELERALRDVGALLDQPARFDAVTLEEGWSHSTGLSFDSVFVSGLTDDGQQLIVSVPRDGGNWKIDADRRFFLWDRSADSWERIDVDTDGRSLQDVRLAQISGDGQTLFLVLRDPELLGWDPPLEIPLVLSSPVLKAPDFDPFGTPIIDERSFPIAVTQPNEGVGQLQCVVRLAQPDDGAGWWQTTLELQSPRGDRIALSSNSEQTGQTPSDVLVFDFGSGSDEDFSGEWTLRLAQSSRCCGQAGIVVEGLEFRFDLAPFALVRRPLEGDTWEVLTLNASAELADLHAMLWLEVSSDGQWATFTAWGNDLVPETMGEPSGPLWMPRAYLLDCENKEARLLSSKAATGHNHPGLAPSISAAGDRVAFMTSAPLAPEDTNNLRDAYLYDRVLDQYALLSVSASGLPQTSVSGSAVSGLTISADGRTVAFRSNSATLAEDIPLDWTIAESIFVRDLEAGVTELLDDPWEGSYDPVVSPDGRYVYFHTASSFNLPVRRYVYDRELDESRLLASAADGADALLGFGTLLRTTRIARVAGQAVLKGNFGTLLLHDFGGDTVQPFHVRGTPATFVAMGQAGLFVSSDGASVGIPVNLHPGSDALSGSVTATFTTSGFTALPWRNYRDEALSVTLSTAAPTQTLEIPFHSYDFLIAPGLFEVRLDSVSGPARIGHPRSTVVSLAEFADPDRYAEWLLWAFPNPADRGNPLVSGPLVDAEGDGWFNLLEFALGFDPLAFDEGTPLGFQPADFFGRDTFSVRYNTRSGLRYYLEVTDDFYGWNRYEIEKFEILVSSDLGDGIVELTLRWPFAQDWARFYRLRIEAGD